MDKTEERQQYDSEALRGNSRFPGRRNRDGRPQAPTTAPSRMLGSPKEAELGPHPRPCGGARPPRRGSSDSVQRSADSEGGGRRGERASSGATGRGKGRENDSRPIGEKPRTQLLMAESEGKVTETKAEVDSDRSQTEKLKGKRREQLENQAPTYQHNKRHGGRQPTDRAV